MYLNLNSSLGSVVDISGRRGEFSVPITASTTVHLTNTIWELEASRTLAHGSSGFLDVNAGARGIYSTVGANWSLVGPNELLTVNGSVNTTATIVDAIVGAHGRVNLGSSRWYAPYYFDYGWGDGNTTAQQWLGLGYQAKHGQGLSLVYRNMAYWMTGDGPFQSIRFSGPAVSYSFGI